MSGDERLRVANRYRLEESLGKGGMGVVYRAFDCVDERPVALKRLRSRQDPERRAKLAALFEREYCTLSGLEHPHVIRVYDYGVDADGPFYTMELLEGSDLHAVAPVPWREACVFLRDVASCLALLHSRRVLHRDITPHNVWCTDGRAKLIDFGGMAPMGPNKEVVGTPPFVAPEVVRAESLDGRVDLYALGALAYWALTRRHAYPARNFRRLSAVWSSKPPPPSAMVGSIPEALDQLVLSLLSLDPMGRPVNAAEVMERLTAIAGLERDETLEVSQAYLSKPILVGREESLSRIRKLILRAQRGRGGTVMITGASGVGRSRFLDACALEGKLAGVTVLRADAGDAVQGNWGGVQALARQLLEAVPEVALTAAEARASVLGHVLPHLMYRLEIDRLGSPESAESEIAPPEGVGIETDSSEVSEGTEDSSSLPRRARAADNALKDFDTPQELRLHVQAALRDWMMAVSRQECLMVAVDDVHRIDEPSAAFVAFLSSEVSKARLVVVVTAERAAQARSAAALKMLSEAGARIKLRSLASENTEELLLSVFGEVPNVRLWAHRLHSISAGNPGAIMQLAQHLVDREVVRYRAGAWALPGSLDSCDLPASVADALGERVETLDPGTRELAQALALCPGQSLSFEECLTLTEHGETARLIRDLEALVAAAMLSTDGERYSISQSSWVEALTQELDEAKRQVLHLRLAEMFEQRGTQSLLVVQHLSYAAQHERALDRLIEHVEQMYERSSGNPQVHSDDLLALPLDWVEIYESAIELCQQLGRPRRQRFLLKQSLVRYGTIAGAISTTHVIELAHDLAQQSGLAAYHELGDSVPASARLGRALELAQERFSKAPEEARALPPGEAIRALGGVLSQAARLGNISLDCRLVEALPALEPFVPLSPALDVIDRVVQAFGHSSAARYEQAREVWLGILRRIEQPDRGGLEETPHRYLRLGLMAGLGITEAGMGLPSALEWADATESDPFHQANAWRTRLIHALRQGNAGEEERCKRRVEALQIQRSAFQFADATHLMPMLMAFSAADHLTGIKGTLDEVRYMADRFECWAPLLYLARGEYQRIRGDYSKALRLLERARQLIEPGRHAGWAVIEGARLKTLTELGRLAEARALGREFLEQAEKVNLDIMTNLVSLPLAVAEAKLGEYETAVERCDTVIEHYEALGVTGLNLGAACEARARVAIFMGDRESFETYADLCSGQYRAGGSPVLIARYERLLNAARRFGLDVSSALAHGGDVFGTDTETALSAVASMLTDCRGGQERAERALDILVEQSGSRGGFLYTIRKSGPVFTAESGGQPPPAELDSWAEAYLAAEIGDWDQDTVTTSDAADSSGSGSRWADSEDENLRPFLLSHQSEEGLAVTGLVILCVDGNTEVQIPYQLATSLSKLLLDAGDVDTIFAQA